MLVVLTSCSLAGEKKVQSALPTNFYSSASNVCALVKEGDLEAILGHRYSQGVGAFNPDFQPLPGVSACTYERAVDGSLAPRVYVGVVYAYAGQIFREHISFLRAVSRARAVKEVGEKAVWDPALFQLFVLEKDKMLAFQAFPDLEPKRDHLIRTRRLAVKAIGRLR